jgi:parvulin-like peptidyl-prolyl isomerase
LKNIIKEPLLHFLLLGGALYIFYTFNTLYDTPSATQNSQKTTLCKEQIDQLQKSFTKEFGKKPSPQMTALLVQQEQTKELLLNEAYRRKLYKEDKRVQKLLLDKMHFLLNAAIQTKEPTENALREYYKKHIKEYSKRENISFYRLHFAKLTKKQREDFYNLAHTLQDFSDFQKISDMPVKNIQKSFGNYFLQQILQLQKGVLSHAIPSKEGYEFVYITDYNTSTPYSFDTVEERVRRDYIYNKETAVYKELLEKMQQ